MPVPGCATSNSNFGKMKFTTTLPPVWDISRLVEALTIWSDLSDAPALVYFEDCAKMRNP
jgi:hypothetical protein